MFPPVLNSKPLMPVIPNQGFLHHRGYFCSTQRGEEKRNKYVYIYISTYWISCRTWTLHGLQQAEESRWELTGKWLKILHINRSSSSAYCVFLLCNLQQPCLKVQFGEKLDFWASFPIDVLRWRCLLFVTVTRRWQDKRGSVMAKTWRDVC